MTDSEVIDASAGEKCGQFSSHSSLLLRSQFCALRSLCRCVNMNWLAIVVGPSDAGKTSVVRLLAELAGRELKVLSVNAAMDTTEILGGFEQVDYNRHLESLTSTVGRHLFDVVRRLLVTSTERRDTDRVAQDLLSQWDKHRRLGAEMGTGGSTGDHFRTTAQSLHGLIAAVSSHQRLPEATLSLLNDQLDRLLASVDKEGNLNAGGKFEWVDSVLVKCLMDGTWLLIDNVNLCSPAVLDRLNGLLEPSGTLVVGERGVQQDGKLFTVKPHPAFRIFMAMDPKNGEISRAMRNRGIEIHIPASTGLEFPLDARSLLSHAGLSGKHQEALLAVHQQLSTLMQVPGGLGVSYLLRAAFLLSQQIQRGFSFNSIFPTTCREIYVRPNSAWLADVSNDTLEAIVSSSVVPDEEIATIRTLTNNSNALFTLCTQLLREDSRYACVKQSGAIIEAILSTLKSELTKTITIETSTSQSNNEEKNTNVVKLDSLLQILCLVFYEISSFDDNDLRHEWVTDLVVPSTSFVTNNRSILKISEVLCKTIDEFKSTMNREVTDLPWDLRWLPDVKSGDEHSSENKLALLLQFNAKFSEVFDNRDSPHLTVLKYSENVLQGLCSDSLTKEPIIVSSSLMVTQLSACLTAALHSRDTHLDLEHWATLHDGLDTLFQLFRQFLQPAAADSGKKVNVNVKTLNVLYVHVKWMSKRFLPQLNKLVVQDKALFDSEPIQNLRRTMKTVMESIPASSLPLVGIGRRVRKELGQPFPFPTQQHSELALGVHSLCDVLDMWTEHAKLTREIPALLTNECIQARSELIKAKLLIASDPADNDSYIQVGNVINQTEETFAKLSLLGHLVEESPDLACSLTIKQAAYTDACTQLWPLQELVALIAGGEFRRSVLTNNQVSNKDLGVILSQLVSAPPALAAAVRSFQCNGQSSRRNVAELTSLLMRHATMSVALRNAGNSTDQRLGEETIHPLHCPLLTRLVLQLTLPHNAALPTEATDKLATLGAHLVRKQQLATVLQILWRNMASLTDVALDFNKNDSFSAIAAYENLLHCLEVVLIKEVECSGKEVPSRTRQLNEKLADFVSTEASGDNNSLRSFKDCLNALESDVGTLRRGLQDKCSDIELVTMTGKVWIGVGFLQMVMFANLGYMDPIAKKQIKLKRALEELEAIKVKLVAYELQSQVLGNEHGETDDVHPFVDKFKAKADALKERSDYLKKFVAYRPDDGVFTSLAKETFHFAKSLCSPEVVFGLQERLIKEMNNETVTPSMNSVLQEAKNWQESQKRFYVKIDKEYRCYPDLVMPILSASTQLGYGIHLVSSALNKMVVRINYSLTSPRAFHLITSLALFPSESLPALVENCVSGDMKRIITKTLSGECVAQETCRLVKASLEELRNYVAICGSFNVHSWQQLTDILKQLVASWREQQKVQADKQKEEDSMFVKRSATRCENLTDEQQTLADMNDLFPSTIVSDFGDLERFASLEQNQGTRNTQQDSELVPLALLNDNDINDVCSLHSDLVQMVTKTYWMMPNASNKLGDTKQDFVHPFVERCKTFSLLLAQLSPGFDNAIDKRLTPSLATLTSLTLDAVDGRCNDSCIDASPTHASKSNHRREKYDFYHDARVEQVKECLPILTTLTTRIEELLAEWPEHPTLNQIMTIVNRIRGFPIVSPVSRFLTGLELLLTKLQEWEENAHKGVTLCLQMQSVTHQIIAWRKLELNVWKDLLAITADKVRNIAWKWWFHIYSLVEEFTTVEGDEQRKELILSLKRFIEESSLGEFDARLDLLLSFHCHVVHLQPASNRDELSNILWNLHRYYGQFSENVNAQIALLRAPIEKKLRDFVKIARWNDISYWAIKETVDKTHRTLLKHIKEFENVLKQPVRDALVNANNEVSVINDGLTPNRSLRNQQNKYFLEPSQFIASPSKHEIAGTELEVESELLSKADWFFSKSRKLCKETILATSYPRLVQSVDSLVGDIIQTSNHLKNLEVSKELTKEKQKSQAKSFLQQKRMTLADLFKTLQTLGLSYRLGLAEWATSRVITDYTVPPVDLKAALTYLKSRRCDHQLLAVWDGCEDYFLKLSARVAMLDNAMQNPSKDLGPPNLERIRGFSIHLMRVTQQQKKEVTKTSNTLFELRCQISQLQQLEESVEQLPSQVEMLRWETRVKSLLVTVIVSLEQFSIVLSSCPSSGDVEFQVPLLESNTRVPPIDNAVNGDSTWQSASSQVNNLLSVARRLKNGVDKAMALKFTELGGTNTKGDKMILPNQYQVLSSSFAELKSFADELNRLQAIFTVGSHLEHPVTYSLVQLEELLRGVIAEHEEMTARLAANATVYETPMEVEGTENSEVDVQAFTDEAERLLQKILFAIQQLYKKYTEPEVHEEKLTEASTQEDANEDCDEPIEENHLREKISRSLDEDFSLLCLDSINKRLGQLMRTLSSDSSREVNICKRVLSRCAPCLEQLTLLAQYFLTQQVAAYRASAKLLSVLLSVFLNLAKNGFCIPADMAAGEGDMEQASGGMGLGDGEGENDVSERIESEDQLEDARPQGEEKKDEDKDCKEEEKGIEMSEEFGGRAQELEEKERQEGDEDESAEEDEPDKEMGETEEGAEKLDQQIWGDDDEEEEPEDDEEGDGKQDGLEKGEGEKDGAPELGAKDEKAGTGEDDQAEGDEQDDDDGKKKKKNKEINEMQEPEQDDDHVDPYHGNHPPEIEPEDLDLPDDLQLDDGDMKDNAEDGEENPFDVDEMKDQMPPETEGPEENTDERAVEPPNVVDSSDDEDDGSGEKKDNEPMDAEDQDLEKEPQPEESGGKMGEDEDKEQAEEDKKQADEDKAKPSDDLSNTDQAQPAEEMDVDGSKDQVCGESAQTETAETQEPAKGNDKERVGQAQTEDQESGHQGEATSARDSAASSRRNNVQRKEKRKKPGQSDSSRSLGNVEEPVNKKLKTIEAKKQEKEVEDNAQEEGDKNEELGEQGEMFQHIKDANQSYDTQALDAATQEQAEKQPVPNLEDEKGEELKEDDDIDLEEDDIDQTEDNIPKEISEKLDTATKQSKDKKDGRASDKADDMEVVEVEGDNVETTTVQRGNETTYHTIFGEMSEQSERPVDQEETLRLMRSELETQLANWSQAPPTREAEKAWELFSAVTEDLARNLSEQLRLVLEPTQAARLRGDYRTGRRINMRKVIPYIASHFRKDKIWLRRTKPSKREYQIVLAIDDSSSMADNHSKELAFESLAVVSKALTLLEAGELAVVSFGETSKVLHKLGEPFTQHCGASLLQQFTFEQNQTRVGQLVDFTSAVLAAGTTSRSVERSQLLVIVSDGRGVFSEGPDKVKQAVRRAKLAGLFIVFIIVDNPDTKDSILDIRVPTFKDGKVSINSYLDGFPFPFYLILRDINALPTVLSEALRQWFELVTNPRDH